MGCVISFRAPGKAAQGLIAEGYGMKGFRIDTKSCDWGPTCGFVCADPRLSKRNAEGGSYQAKNLHWTEEALGGHINTKFFEKAQEGTAEAAAQAEWVADVMPIVLSATRIAELEGERIIAAAADGDGHKVGVAGQDFKDLGRVTLPYRLVPVGNAGNGWLKGATRDHYVLCVDRKARTAFQQLYPSGAEPVTFRGFEAILGLCNPGTKGRGFKACVTADYDLFSIWPTWDDVNGKGGMTGMHALSRVLGIDGGQSHNLPGGPQRQDTVDTRLQAGGAREHWRYGDVSARVLTIKVMLNTALQSAGYPGGNLVHHNDEAGNFALAKGSLAECLPLIAFVPGKGTKGVASLSDFKELAYLAADQGHRIVCKPDWCSEAGI
jgi:hypothetical protein